VLKQHHDEVHAQGFEAVTEKTEQEECELVRVRPDGTLVVRSQGVEREIQIGGIELPVPLPPLCFAILERLARQGKPLRCSFPRRRRKGRVCARVQYYAWHDKSGHVWADLATALREAAGVDVRGEGANVPGGKGAC
jgi:endonuclease YncB( thermonuclease family)